MKEPVLWVNMAMSLVRSGFLLALSMGWIVLTQEQLEAWMGFLALLLPMVDLGASWLVRARVTPTAR